MYPRSKIFWYRSLRTMARLGRVLWQNLLVLDHLQRLPTPLRMRWEYASKNSLSALRKSCGRSTVSHQHQPSWITTCCNSSEGQMASDNGSIPEALYTIPSPGGTGGWKALYHHRHWH